jgi:hypothetical protein
MASRNGITELMLDAEVYAIDSYRKAGLDDQKRRRRK